MRTPGIRAIVVAAVTTCALTLTACGGSSSLEPGSSPSGSASGGSLATFKVGYVPSLSTLPYTYAKDRGYYKQAGLDVTLSPTDAGPTIVTGVINGTYDAGWIALFPLLIAVSKGAPLKVVLGNDQVSPRATTSGLIVKAGSPIKTYQDLDGKKVATNALTSLTTLAVKIAIDRDGGDAKTVKFVSLPFKSSLQAVARGQVDAATTIQPFVTEAQVNGMRSIGHPIDSMMPEGSEDALVFTSAKTAKGKSSQIAAFRKATERAMKELNANESLQRKLAQSTFGLSATVAEKVGLVHYNGAINIAKTQLYASLTAKYGYTSKPVDIRSIVVQ